MVTCLQNDELGDAVSVSGHACLPINVHVQVCTACMCVCVGACIIIHVCINMRVLAGQSAIVQRRPQSLLLPPTRHNKEQLNAAALPAEEPTASHTSTNRQICLKPKGRSNKSQPTKSNPTPLSNDSKQKVTGWLQPITHYHKSSGVSVTCAGFT